MSTNFTPDEMIELINKCFDRGPCGNCPFFDSEEPCQDVLLRAAGEMIRELKGADSDINIGRKTYAEDFFEKFPEAPIEENNDRSKRPSVCRAYIYGTSIKGCSGYFTGDCAACWLELMPEED